jgi:hypothetical protein
MAQAFNGSSACDLRKWPYMDDWIGTCCAAALFDSKDHDHML